MFSNMSKPVIGPAVSQVLDVIGEIRVNRLTEDQLRDSDVIRKWFSGRLRVFLPSASGVFLHCLSTKNLSCDSYQQILREFSNQFDQMDQMRQELVVKYFIQPFLTKNSSVGCVSNSNSSVDWLQKNLGRFSVLVSLSDLLKLNTDFSPLSALEVLSPKQTAELVVLPLPGLPGKDVIINTVFDFLSKSPKERRLPEFLYHLMRLSVVTPVGCTVYQTIFVRLYQAMSALPQQMEPIIWASVYDLTESAPMDCSLVPVNQQCPVSSHNATRVCAGVDSSALQQLLDSGISPGRLCDYSIKQYACSQLKDLNAENLVTLLKCKLSENNTDSKETWKLFFTKASAVLDQALVLLSNQSKPVIGPAVSQVLDVIGEIRVNRLTEDQLRDSDVIRKWFSGRLRVFLPSASGVFLHCLSTKNLSCDSYQAVATEFGAQFDHMNLEQQQLVLKELVVPFLSRPTSVGCVSNSNSSVDWLQKNLGRFSVLVSLSDLLKLNTDFSPLSALEVLSPKQTAELVVLPLPGLPGKDVIINTVFDFLSKSPKERRLPEFLYHLSRLSVVTPVGCTVYQTIFVRLYQAMSALPQQMEPIIWASVYDLTESAPMDCSLVPVNQQCPVSSHNATRVCAGVDSSALQQLLDSGISPGRLCDYSIKQYACSQLKDLNTENLVTLLKCKLSENNTDSKETWKLFFTKASAVLDQALVLLSNQSKPVIGPAVSQVLDVIGEIRVNRLTEDQLRDSDVIRKWFSGRLRVFLPSASGGFLHCLSTKNLSCDSYQVVVTEFGAQFDHMNLEQQQLVLKELVVPFLSRTTSVGCVSNSNSSVDWLQKNLGRFSVLVSLSDLLKLNTDFSPLSALEVLSPKQTAELVVLPLPGLPGKDVIINTVFDFLSKSPKERRLPEFLYHLSRLSVVTPVGCTVYQTIFVRLYQAMSALPQQMEPIIWASVYDLTESAPMDCSLVPVNQQCPVSSHNATRVCAGVDSSALQQLLDSGISPGRLCDYSIKQYACSQLKDLNAENLVTLLKCKLSENNTDSKETWELFFTKASAVLDQALVLLSNQSKPVIGPAVSQVLDVIGEIRVNRLTEDQLRDSDVIRKWFSGRLRVFLPSASGGFLHCLSTKNLSCDSYQVVVTEFGAQFDHMNLEQQQLVLKELVVPFLSRPTSDSGCVSNSNSSVDWLQKNLGPFSVLVFLGNLLKLNLDFSPLSALEVLSPKQTAELVVLPLPGLPGKDVIINTVFDFLTESPKERRLPEFLYHLARLSEETMLPCDSFKTISERLYQALPSPEMETVIQAIIDNLMQTAPEDCLPMNMKCPITPANDTRVCEGNASDSLHSYLATSNTTNVSCNFTLEEYACASLKDFTAEHLVSLLKCNLPGNSSHSKETWKVLLTKLTSVLDQALDMFSNMSKPVIGPAVSQVLDVIGEIRVNRLTEDQLRDSDVIRKWFSGRLRVFLPSASGGFCTASAPRTSAVTLINRY
ncbi:uncharacterized protein LOC135534057 [Oncorhynchus masou masou]|uniref:uncharacterized protein LOC135534057 n=1 Tax=Oncorhynchus masou masou TaxID=90313 RepID=UPI003183C706